MPFATRGVLLFLVVRPGAPSGVLAPSSDARSHPTRHALQTRHGAAAASSALRMEEVALTANAWETERPECKRGAHPVEPLLLLSGHSSAKDCVFSLCVKIDIHSSLQ